MKRAFTYFLLLGFVFPITAQNLEFLKNVDCEIKQNLYYGKYDRNTLDIIIPNNPEPHGLVIYIHGGGFTHGDKKSAYNRKQDIMYFLDHNIAFATVNYRFYKNNDSLGVKVCLEDIQHVIQYLKFNASKFNIDKNRVGCYGGSAGAGSSLYFALHDDLAIKGDTTLLGESTRLQCAGTIATQATYNLFRWKKFIPWLGMVITLKRKYFFNYAANFYGYPDYKSFKPHKKGVIRTFDMLDMVDANDPPIYQISLLKASFPKDFNVIFHHKKHAIAMSKKLNKHGVKNYLYTHKQATKESEIDYSIKEFLVEHLRN